MRFEEHVWVKPRLKSTQQIDPYLAINKLGPKPSQIRPLQKLVSSTIAPIKEAKEEDEEHAPSHLNAFLKVEVGRFPPEEWDTAL